MISISLSFLVFFFFLTIFTLFILFFTLLLRGLGLRFLILDSFNSSIINLSGYKKLNGSQLTKGGITYILNSLKSEIHEKERQKSTIHIFNSNYHLDKKKINNLPIGLFGNFYSQELSFYLIDNNDFKNLYTCLHYVEERLDTGNIVFKKKIILKLFFYHLLQLHTIGLIL